MYKCRSQFRTHSHYLVTNQVNGLPRVVNTFYQHLGSTRLHLDISSVSVSVGSLESTSLVSLVNLIHAVGHNAQSNRVFNNYFCSHTHEEVGLSTYPLFAAHGLDALGDIEVVAKVPALTVIGDGIDREDVFLARIHKCTSLTTCCAKGRNNHYAIIDIGIVSLSKVEGNTSRTTQVSIIGIAQF